MSTAPLRFPSRSSEQETDQEIIRAVKASLAARSTSTAREKFGAIVERHQRRASRIAYAYLREIGDTDEAVQDAFVKAYTRLDTFRDELPFDLWFTRILINGCLDRLKSRQRHARWWGSLIEGETPVERPPFGIPPRNPEQLLLQQEDRRRIGVALTRLPERQRSVFLLNQLDGRTAREIAAITGLRESTVRVHLFRALRKLRTLLKDS